HTNFDTLTERYVFNLKVRNIVKDARKRFRCRRTNLPVACGMSAIEFTNFLVNEMCPSLRSRFAARATEGDFRTFLGGRSALCPQQLLIVLILVYCSHSLCA